MFGRAVRLSLLLCIVAFGARAQEWVEIIPASGPAPTARTLSAAIYDPVAHAMIVFGGQDSGGRLNDVWSFDLSANAWTDITPSSGSAPAGRITPSTVYDAGHHTLLTFSGQGSGGTFFNDTWSFDLTSHTWTQFAPPDPIPNIRYGVASCYDAVAETMVIFAGFTFMGRFDDTWRFDAAADDWDDVSPVSGRPLERCLHAACYDEQHRRMIMYGGQNGGPLGDIWAFDLVAETWTELTPVTAPDPRWFAAFEYDAVNRRATLFGGNRGTLGKANDVWVFDLSLDEWVELMPAGTAPSQRDGAAAIHVPAEDRMVVFGGSSSTGSETDVWSLEALSETPTGVTPDSPPSLEATLHQNYPNPFHPRTVIEYELSSRENVVLRVFDARGAHVRTLHTGVKSPGMHAAAWDGTNDAGRPVGSGLYFYRLQTGTVTTTKRMVLLR